MPILAGTVDPAVSLEELKEHLNLSTTSTANDGELSRHLDAAVNAIEKRVGPIVNRTFTERVEARGGRLVVNHTPLVEVTSITEVASGVGYTSATFDPDPSGVITGANGWRFARGRHDITYVAGRGTTASSDFKLAILYVAEHFWELQRKGTSGRPGLYGEETEGGSASAEGASFVYRGFALPRRALELIAGDEEIGFA